jgi:hypothetical protein
MFFIVAIPVTHNRCPARRAISLQASACSRLSERARHVYRPLRDRPLRASPTNGRRRDAAKPADCIVLPAAGPELEHERRLLTAVDIGNNARVMLPHPSYLRT